LIKSYPKNIIQLPQECFQLLELAAEALIPSDFIISLYINVTPIRTVLNVITLRSNLHFDLL